MENDNSSEKLHSPLSQSSTGIPVNMSVPDSSSQKLSDQQKTYSDAWFKELEDKFLALQREVDKVKGFEESLTSIQESIIDANQQIEKIASDLKQQTKNNLELFGTFATLFTFISVSVSIVLQFETVFHAVFVLMSFLTGLMIFLYVFHHLLHHEHKPLEPICYEPGKSRCISLIKHLWKTGNFCYSIPFILAVLCGFIALLIGPDDSSSCKKEGAAHINYIQNVPTSKINMDQSRNEGETQVETTKNSKTIDKNHK